MNLWGKKLKLLALAVTATLITAIFTSPATADAFDPARLDKPEGHVTLTIGDGGLSVQSILMIQPPDPAPGQERGEWRFCNSTKDPVCDFSDLKLDILATVVLPLCESADDENCIESLSMTMNGKSVEAVYLRDAAAGNRVASDPELNFFRGGTPILFDVPGAVHAGGTSTYAVTATANRRFDHKTKKFITGNLALDVVPYTIKFDPDYDLGGYGYGKNIGCLFIEMASCAVREDFPEDLSVKLSVRAPMDIAGWFMGRVKNPEIEVEKISSSNNRIRVSAEPATVARFALVKSPEAITPAVRKAMGNYGISGTLNGSAIGALAFDEGALETLDYFRKEVGDKAAGVNSLWSVGTIDSPSVGCFADRSKVLGIVATNAMVYNGGAPRYEDGFLSYRVGGMHYMPNGRDLVTGTYDLIMRSETARCLYGFTNAPVSATVSVIGAAGQERVATTVVSERGGWLKLAAYGFTFSRKEVRVTLTQPQRVRLSSFAPKSSSLSAPQKQAIRKFSSASRTNKLITCSSTYFDSAGKDLASRRAQAACAEAKRLIPKTKIKVVAKQVSRPTEAGVTELSSR